jgi:flagellum-specific ATP synthase
MIVRIGAYAKGSDPELDEALAKKTAIEKFLMQDSLEIISFEEALKALVELVSA